MNTDYIKKYSPDILMMQEIKTEEINFPFDEFKKLKYNSYVFGQKSYNGVAIISKKKLTNIKTDLIKGVSKKQIAKIISNQIFQKQFTPDNVCDLVEILISNRANTLSGQVFHLGGV